MLSTMIIGCSSKSSSTAGKCAESNALSALADLKGSLAEHHQIQQTVKSH